jgi:hypothetical protein
MTTLAAQKTDAMRRRRVNADWEVDFFFIDRVWVGWWDFGENTFYAHQSNKIAANKFYA